MKLIQNVLLLAILYRLSNGKDEHCLPADTFTTRLTIDNYRNDSGHWISEVELIHSDDADQRGLWNIVVNQSTSKCENGSASVKNDFVALYATLSSLANTTEAENWTISKPYFINVRMGIMSPIGPIKLSLTPLRWEDARQACKSNGDGDLVDVRLLNTTYRYMQRTLILYNIDMAYVDLRRNRETQHEFQTHSGFSLKDVNFLSFAPGRPATKGPLAIDACGALTKKKALLHDVYCENPLPFFCNRPRPQW